MQTTRILGALALVLAATPTLHAQMLKDGTSLVWNKEISVSQSTLQGDGATYTAMSVPVYEAKASQVWALLKTELPGAVFRKEGQFMKASGVSFSSALSSPVDIVAKTEDVKKMNMSTLTMAFLAPGTTTVVEDEALNPAMRELSVKLNKAVVQQQVNEWSKKLGKADSKTASAAKAQDKAQGKANKAQAKLTKITKEKSKLQNQHAVLQKEIDLHNQKWTLSQNPKDLKKLTKAREKITKNDGKMAKLMDQEAKAQKEVAKTSSNLPDAEKAKDEKAATQAEVQRTVDALQRKLENIR
ncbi:MAG TPA: hypothetical protein PKD45_10445 [Flavobacteriales bacterium]|nr:hypothetical protein [Flavobacteriales bacterium]